MSLFNELKRRNVFRVGAAYMVTAWLLIEVTETILPLFGFDQTPARIVVIVLAIGFVPALIFAWVFELTPMSPAANWTTALSACSLWRWPILPTTSSCSTPAEMR